MRICDRWMQEGTTDQRGRSNPPECTTSRKNRQIVCKAVKDHSVTSRTIAHHIVSVTHHSVSACSIRHRVQHESICNSKTSIARSTLYVEPQTSPPPMVG
ncbi:uncharacterized protein TNCV_1583971 [Trichonephila clavipes]|nr:uncharacterized protein TNCV_1583971 [Trichonephila clavipes]